MASRGAVLKVPVKEYLLEPAKLIIIPITTQRVYLYYKQRDDILSKNSIAIRLESWLTKKSESTWCRMENSPRPTNQKIVRWVNMLLNKTPWTEDSLKTLPAEERMLKRVVTRDVNGKEKIEHLTVKQFNKRRHRDSFEIKPLHAYYPSNVISPDQLSLSLRRLYTKGLLYHWKQAVWCLLGLPLTLPIVLVPIIPNIPGFYLTYRAYCNYKAYNGARHLQSLHEKDNLQPRDVQGFSEMFNNDRELEVGQEQLLLDKNLMARILDLLEIQEIEPDLEKTIMQEQNRLGL